MDLLIEKKIKLSKNNYQLLQELRVDRLGSIEKI